MKIAAGIVTYQPNLEKLKRNIAAISGQVDAVYIFDNHSAMIDEICAITGERCMVIRSNKNVGIARALNVLAQSAEKDGVDWLLTLDQDSEVFPKLIALYRNYLDKAASLTCYRKDRNIDATQEEDDGSHEVPYCITSGNLVNLSVWREIGGFNERLFIDMVDIDFCFRMTAKGYKILCIHRFGFLHEIGDGSFIKILGKKRFTGNYSAFRKYYIFRNMAYVIRKYKLHKHYYSYKRLGMLFFSILVSEKNKWNKSKSAVRGFIHSFTQYEYLDGWKLGEEDEEEHAG